MLHYESYKVTIIYSVTEINTGKREKILGAEVVSKSTPITNQHTTSHRRLSNVRNNVMSDTPDSILTPPTPT